jgi:ribonucleotide reductase beta subunit family protein with ferritin-like domain
MSTDTEAWEALSEDQKNASWAHMKTFWDNLSEEQRNTIKQQLDHGIVSPEVVDKNGQRAYIDGIQHTENGELRIIGQLV